MGGLTQDAAGRLAQAVAAWTASFAAVRRAALPVLGAVALILGTAACGGGGDDKTFKGEGIGITFTYPSAFKRIHDVSFRVTAGAKAAARAGVALDADNAIVVSRYDLRLAIKSANLAQFKDEVDAVIAKVAGRPVSGGRVDYGGLPGYEYTIPLANPADGRSHLVVLFDEAKEDLISCQSRPDKRDAVDAACRQALDTLRPK